MMDYLYIFFYCLGGIALLSMVTNFSQYHKEYGIFYWSILLLFFTLSFLRWERGADWTAYMNMYEQLDSWSDVLNYGSSFEKGYKYIAAFVHLVFNNYTVFLFLQGAIISFCMGWTMWKFSPSPIYSLFVYYALIFANIFFVRQYIAIAITFFAFNYIVKRQFGRFTLCVLLATQFHTSAIIFLLAYPIYKWRFSTMQLCCTLVGTILISVLLSQLILTLFGSMGGFVGGKIAHYLQTTEEGIGSMRLPTLGDLTMGLLSRFFIICSTLFFLGRVRLNDVKVNGIVNIYLFGIILYSFTAPISLALVRIVNYYDFFIILLIPYILHRSRLPFNRFTMTLIFSVYLFTRFVSLNNQYAGTGQGSPFSPYKSVFDKKEQVDGIY